MSDPHLRSDALLVSTAELLRLTQIGLHSNSQRLFDAGESLLSVLVLNLRKKTALVPAELRPHLELLRKQV